MVKFCMQTVIPVVRIKNITQSRKEMRASFTIKQSCNLRQTSGQLLPRTLFTTLMLTNKHITGYNEMAVIAQTCFVLQRVYIICLRGYVRE